MSADYFEQNFGMGNRVWGRPVHPFRNKLYLAHKGQGLGWGDIFNGDGLFTHTIEQMSERDGSNTHEVMQSIFRAMNIKVAERTNAQPRLPNWANGFPYVNGGLFSGGLPQRLPETRQAAVQGSR